MTSYFYAEQLNERRFDGSFVAIMLCSEWFSCVKGPSSSESGAEKHTIQRFASFDSHRPSFDRFGQHDQQQAG
jgi:hypothetical protein